MANNNEWTAQQAIVVGGRGDDPVIVDNFGGLKRQARVWTAVLSVIMLFAALLVGATGAQMAAADDSPSPSASESSSPSALVEDSQGYITDPQNLLGDNLTKVIDAANRTKQETGVTVRLLYLESFNTTEKPEQWASQLLESLNPPANTVMLAVASHDGNLVVVVSPNSDEWLRSQSTAPAFGGREQTAARSAGRSGAELVPIRHRHDGCHCQREIDRHHPCRELGEHHRHDHCVCRAHRCRAGHDLHAP